LQLKECLDTIEDLKESLKKYELEDDKDEDDSYTYESVIQDNLTNLTNPIPLINPEIKILRDNIMTPLKEHIKEKRPTLSDSSVNTYTSILKSLYRKAFGEGNMDFDDFEKSDVILEFLKDLEPNKRKTIMSALVVICKDPKPYRVQMLDDIKETSANTAKQEKTPEQEEHWITQDALRAKFAELGQDSAHTYKKKTLAMADLQKIQDFIIIALFHLIAPRRAQDYTEFKIKGIDKEKDNWFDDRINEFVFTKYKTAKFYGEQRLPIGKDLKLIIKKWIKSNPTEYLLFDTNGSKLSTVKLNQRLNRIFGSDKGCSVNNLRHSYLSDKYQDSIKMNEELAKEMTDMGSSISQSKIYINKE
jgi:hypothetical protein